MKNEIRAGTGFMGKLTRDTWGGRYRQLMIWLLPLIALCHAGGCVERLIHVRSEPPGAIIWLNDEEVGATPLTVPFTWYGTYDVVLRKAGHEPLHTTQTARAPVYQWLGIDLLAEVFWPFTITDEHEWEFVLSPLSAEDPNLLVQRAADFRDLGL